MPKRQLPRIEDEDIILRPLEKSDLPLTLLWRNQEPIRRWFMNPNVVIEQNHGDWFEGYIGSDTDFVFLILSREFGNIPIGQISLYGIDWPGGIAEYGRLMIGHMAARGKGYAKQATRLLLEFGFGDLGLKEIHLKVKEGNEPAIAVYHAVGFAEKTRKDGWITMSVQKTTWIDLASSVVGHQFH
jgi:diamine N-acetyltransferase